jgi:sulfatase modifying factor 1
MRGQISYRFGSVGRQFILSLLATLLLAATSLCAADKPLDTAGLVKHKPESGRFVETEQGFMVPYTVAIPGTTVKYTMQPIPGGVTRVGSPATEKGREKTEGPQFEVKVEPFWIGQYEISWAEYLRYMAMHDIFKDFETRKVRLVAADRTVDVITAPSNLYDPSFTFVNGEEEDLPAVTMSQYSAKQYSKWLSLLTNRFYRLPSEAEWEHACRAGTTTAFHFGDDPATLGEYGWYFDNANETTHAVGKKKPNQWGLYDMHGNVAEWVLDELVDGGYAKLAADKKQLSVADAIAWPKKLYPRVVKGGNWDLDAKDCRAASRLGSQDDDWRVEDPNIPLSPWWYTSGPSLGVGMRLVRPLKPVSAEQRLLFWEPTLEQLLDDVKYRIDDEGRGARGYVDPGLPADIEKLKR